VVTLDQGGLGPRLGQRFGRPRRCPEGIESAWTLISPGRNGEDGWRIVPDTHPHAIVHRLASGRVRATLVGSRSRWVDVDQCQRSWTVGVRLSPGTPTALTGERADAFLDGSVPLEAAFGASGGTVARRLEETEEPNRALTLLVDFLARRLRESDSVDWRVRGLVTGRAAWESPAAAACRLGISSRSLREVCAAWIGLSPKAVQRIGRLHGALRLLVRDVATTGAAAAAGAGYADQSHFIRDCRDLLGETPEMFRARGRAGTFKTGSVRAP
jgi:AraC-like DNA-binding protein